MPSSAWEFGALAGLSATTVEATLDACRTETLNRSYYGFFLLQMTLLEVVHEPSLG
jgi:hypothetical protein